MDMPPKLQNQIAQFEQLRQQLQMIASQRSQLEAREKELTRTLEELGQLEGEPDIFKHVGAFFIKVQDRSKLQEELEDQKETLGIRVKTVARQEKQLTERYQSLQTEIQAAVRDIQSGGMPGADAGGLDRLT